MPSVLYEPVMNALFAHLQMLVPVPFAYASRRLMTWQAVVNNTNQGSSPIRQPALFLYDGFGLGGGRLVTDQRGRGNPSVRILHRTIVVYAQLPGTGTPLGPDAVTPGGTVFAPLQEAIEVAFIPDRDGTLTLGGLVSHCWIEGEGIWSPPDIDPNGQGMFTVPVRIMIP